MSTYKYRCDQCKGVTDGIWQNGCKLKVEQDAAPAEEPFICPWALNAEESQANWIRYDGHQKHGQFFISCRGTLISSAYMTHEAAKSFIDDNCLHNCVVVEW